MNVVHLNQIEGYRPLAEVAQTDDYYIEKGPDYISTMMDEIGEPTSASKIAERTLALRKEWQERQGVAEYIGRLVDKLYAADVQFTRAFDTPQAHLPRLFAEQYDVDLRSLFVNPQARLGMDLEMNGRRLGPGFSLSYAMMTSSSKFHKQSFWQLEINGIYGFANLYSNFNMPKAPLLGEGNIAFIPGVEEALTADVELLLNNPPRTS